MIRFRLVLSPPPLIVNGLADWSIVRATQRHVAEVLRYTGGDQVWAARELGVNPSTLYRWLRDYERGQQPSRVRIPRPTQKQEVA